MPLSTIYQLYHGGAGIRNVKTKVANTFVHVNIKHVFVTIPVCVFSRTCIL